MKIQESGENYLETILMLEQKNGSVRSIDIATELDFSKPSVSRAIGILKQGGYVIMDEEGFLALTETGMEIAGKIYERHQLLTEFLTRLGVSEETAAADACKIEHDLSEETYSKMIAFAQRGTLET